ncbi:hypothetical protein [Cupriavidus necator]|uniref:hypothetical protein n=1 Tax=Cupriavidus necator TaxID=106590 RepID=UPI003F737A28
MQELLRIFKPRRRLVPVLDSHSQHIHFSGETACCTGHSAGGVFLNEPAPMVLRDEERRK